MTTAEYKRIIIRTLEKFLKEDSYLSNVDANERSQTHKIAEYLQQILPEYNVDCEYNRNLRQEKTLNFSEIVYKVKDFLAKTSNSDELRKHKRTRMSKLLGMITPENIIADESSSLQTQDSSNYVGYLTFTDEAHNKKYKYIKRVFPDIIAHLRGTNTNKIVIEAKKEGHKRPEAVLFDRIKLGLFTKQNGQFDYDIGFFITLPNKKITNKFTIKMYKDKLVSKSNVYIVNIAEQA